MSLTDEQIQHIATLARLELDEHERESFKRQISGILDYVGKLGEAATDDVDAMSHSIPMHCALRKDVAVDCGEGVQEDMRDAFPDTEGDLLKVPAVFS